MIKYSLLALMCFVSSLAGSLVTVFAMRSSQPDAPRDDDKSFIVAKAITLTDEHGVARVRLQGAPTLQYPNDGQIVIFDNEGVTRLRAGFNDKTGAFFALQNSELPNPDHKRITLAVNKETARVDIGHGELSEIVLQSTPPGEPPSSVISVIGRNGSDASIYTDPFGYATIEVKDLTTASIFRMPPAKPIVPK